MGVAIARSMEPAAVPIGACSIAIGISIEAKGEGSAPVPATATEEPAARGRRDGRRGNAAPGSQRSEKPQIPEVRWLLRRSCEIAPAEAA